MLRGSLLVSAGDARPALLCLAISCDINVLLSHAIIHDIYCRPGPIRTKWRRNEEQTMSKRSVQLNIRTEADVAQALRDEATRRDLPLSEVLKELLTRARASTGTGVWLALPDEVDAALRAVAASEALEPSQVLSQLVAGELQRQLMSMAEGLSGPAGQVRGAQTTRSESARQFEPAERIAKGADSSQGLSLLDDEEEQVGIFTVFE